MRLVFILLLLFPSIAEGADVRQAGPPTLAATATALAADPADCTNPGQVAIGINASGTAQCTATPSVRTLTLNPTIVSIEQGLVVTQSGPTTGGPHSTSVNGYEYNSVNITSGQVRVANNNLSVVGLEVVHFSGGANSLGTHVGIRARVVNVGAHDEVNDDIALSGIAGSAVNAGGTDTGAGALGTLFAGELLSRLDSGATNYFVVSALEAQAGISTGASARYRLGVSIVGIGNLAGAGLDGGLDIGAVGKPWGTGIIFTNIHGAAPVETTGSLLGSDGSSVTVTNFASFPTYTFSSKIFDFAKFSVTGLGEIQSIDGTVTTFILSSSGGASGFFGTRSNHQFVVRTNDTNMGWFFASGGFSISATSVDPGAGKINATNGYTVAGTALAASHLSNGTTGSAGGVVLATGPTISSPIITNIAPGANFTLTQNSVAVMTSVNTGADVNTLYLVDGSIGVNTTTPDVAGVTAIGGRALTVSGTTAAGAIEMITQEADASGIVLGRFFFSDKNATGEKNGAMVRAVLSGATANNRGGELQMWTKANNGAIAQRVTITNEGAVRLAGFTFANIATVLTTNGDYGYCSDCAAGVAGVPAACAGSGTGAFAMRLNGANRCWN